MVTSKYGYEEVVTKEGGRKRNAVCKDYGRHFIRYILLTQLVTSLSDLSWLGNHRLVSFGCKPNQNFSPDKQDLVFLYILGVQNLKHSEATFALFFSLCLSLSDSFLLVAVPAIVATEGDATSLH